MAPRPGGADPLPDAPSEPATELLSVELTRRRWPIPFDQFAFDPVELDGAPAMSEEQKKVVLYFVHFLKKITYYDLLGIQATADDREIRRAYFRHSKAFHPDRWFRKDVGVFGDHISDIFKWLNRAYEVLSSAKKRRGYDELLRRGFVGEWQIEEKQGEARSDAPARAGAGQPQNAGEPTAPKPSAMLLVRARRAESQGSWSEAVDLYGRALQLDPSLDLRIRLIECMLKANLDPREIDRELHGGPAAATEDKRMLLFDAEVARRLGQTERAESSYRRVLALEPANPVARLGLDRLKSRDEER
jgi:tetratricopeptide (TPR) repeat protein